MIPKWLIRIDSGTYEPKLNTSTLEYYRAMQNFDVDTQTCNKLSNISNTWIKLKCSAEDEISYTYYKDAACSVISRE